MSEDNANEAVEPAAQTEPAPKADETPAKPEPKTDPAKDDKESKSKEEPQVPLSKLIEERQERQRLEQLVQEATGNTEHLNEQLQESIIKGRKALLRSIAVESNFQNPDLAEALVDVSDDDADDITKLRGRVEKVIEENPFLVKTEEAPRPNGLGTHFSNAEENVTPKDNKQELGRILSRIKLP